MPARGEKHLKPLTTARKVWILTSLVIFLGSFIGILAIAITDTFIRRIPNSIFWSVPLGVLIVSLISGLASTWGVVVRIEDR